MLPSATYLHGNQQLASSAVPEYHFYPTAAESQDASGTSFVNGRWHVFPDCIPIDNPNKTSLHWCHFSSSDLVHWEEHLVALTPDQPYDTPVIDTGSIAVLPNGTAFAIYATGNTTSIKADGPYDGAICIAVAEDDKLIKWRKLGPVMDNPTPNLFPGMMSRFGFRDPTTPWLAPCPEGTGECWHVVIGSGGVVDNKGQNAALLYTSKSSVDIESWTFGGILFRDTADECSSGQYQYSCPDFFPLPLSPGQKPQDRTWVWMYLNPFFNTYLAPHSNKYFVGKLVNNSRFEPNAATAQNAGNFGHTIAKVASGQGRNLLWGSIALDLAAIPNYLNRSAAHRFGVVSLPKAISMTNSGRLGFAFVPELQVLRENSSAYHASNLPANATFGIKGLQLELLVTFELSNAAQQRAFGVRFSGDNCTVDVGYDPSASELYMSRSSGGVRIAVPHTLSQGEALQMHLFLDGPVLEVIANGRSPSEAQVWPVPESMAVGAFGPLGLSSVVAWRLRSIHA
jgi:sucrose-6-phosphate hydrolase SacC (GH32 family)